MGTYSGGDGGSSGDPYLIANVADWEELAGTSGDWVDGNYFKQTADIDFIAANAIYIGLFGGEYDGNGKVISNITIDPNLVENNSSLFRNINVTGLLKNIIINAGTCVGASTKQDDKSYTAIIASEMAYGGVVQDCDVINCNIEINHSTNGEWAGFIGMIAGSNHGCVTRCRVIGGTVKGDCLVGSGIYVGGVTGYQIFGPNPGENGLTEFCECSATITDLNGNNAELSHIGGIVGNLVSSGNTTGKVENCVFTGSIDYTTSTSVVRIGGIVGNSAGPITNCTSSGTVHQVYNSGSAFLGGIVGVVNANTVINNCHSSSDISATASDAVFMGGIIGNLVDEISLTNSSYSGTLTSEGGGTGAYVGSFIGIVDVSAAGSIIDSCSADFAIVSIEGGTEYIGGGVGFAPGTTFSNCIVNGTITHGGSTDISGIFAFGGFAGYGSDDSVFEHCIAIVGPWSGEGGSRRQGFLGWNAGTGATFTDCFWDKDVATHSTDANATGFTTLQLQTASNLIANDYTTRGATRKWVLEDGSYPQLTMGNWTSFLDTKTVSTGLYGYSGVSNNIHGVDKTYVDTGQPILTAGTLSRIHWRFWRNGACTTARIGILRPISGDDFRVIAVIDVTNAINIAREIDVDNGRFEYDTDEDYGITPVDVTGIKVQVGDCLAFYSDAGIYAGFNLGAIPHVGYGVKYVSTDELTSGTVTIDEDVLESHSFMADVFVTTNESIIYDQSNFNAGEEIYLPSFTDDIYTIIFEDVVVEDADDLKINMEMLVSNGNVLDNGNIYINRAEPSSSGPMIYLRNHLDVVFDSKSLSDFDNDRYTIIWTIDPTVSTSAVSQKVIFINYQNGEGSYSGGESSQDIAFISITDGEWETRGNFSNVAPRAVQFIQEAGDISGSGPTIGRVLVSRKNVVCVGDSFVAKHNSDEVGTQLSHVADRLSDSGRFTEDRYVINGGCTGTRVVDGTYSISSRFSGYNYFLYDIPNSVYVFVNGPGINDIAVLTLPEDTEDSIRFGQRIAGQIHGMTSRVVFDNTGSEVVLNEISYLEPGHVSKDAFTDSAVTALNEKLAETSYLLQSPIAKTATGVLDGTDTPLVCTFDVVGGPANHIVERINHGLQNGKIVYFSNEGGALPAEIVAGQAYYVSFKSDDYFRLSETSGGSVFEFTDDGTGTSSYAPSYYTDDNIHLTNAGDIFMAEAIVAAHESNLIEFRKGLNTGIGSTNIQGKI